MVFKNLPTSIKTVTRVNYWYFVGMSRWQYLCISELLVGSIPFQTILIPGRFYLGMKVLAWYIDPNGIENKITITYPYLTGIKKCEILNIDYLNGVNKRRYQTTHRKKSLSETTFLACVGSERRQINKQCGITPHMIHDKQVVPQECDTLFM